ncbi:hypothetical protein V8C40DRAFT_261116 [Trichoderma camerunense]
MLESDYIIGKKYLRQIIDINAEIPEAVSPSTLKKTHSLLSRLESDTLDENSEHVVSLAKEMSRRVIKATKRLSAESRLTEAMASHVEMEVRQFRLRYGDYIAAYLRDLRGNSRVLQAKGPSYTTAIGDSTPVDGEALSFFKSAKWSAIHERLLNE